MADSAQNVNPSGPSINVAGSDAAAVPTLNTPTPSSLPAAPSVDNAGQPTPATPPPIATTPQAGPVAAAGQNMSAGQHMSTARRILQDVTGGKTTDFTQGPNGPVPMKRDLTGGELARRILASVGSVFAAGAGGALAAKQHRPFELAPGTSLGDIQQGPIEQRRKQAQEQFNNTQTANEAVLRQHRDAMEQQKSIQDAVKAQDEHDAAVQARTMNSRALDEKNYDDLVKHTVDYNQALAMPGSQVMKDANGQELNFTNPREAQDYAIKHPEVLHGSTNGDSKYGVVIKINPWTGAYQLIDYPADRHDVGIANFGQKLDKNGEPMFDKDNNPVPDGTVLDPKTHKPTVLTQTVSPDQARAIASQTIKDADTRSQMNDREAQSRKYDAEADKFEELARAQEIMNSSPDGISKLNSRQVQVLSRALSQQQTLMSKREMNAEANLAKVLQLNTADSPEAKKAQLDYDQAKSDYDDVTEQWGKLTGNTAGVRFANAIIRQGIGNTPWADVDKQIMSAPISDDEKQAAKAKVWNSLSPAQQAAANPSPQQQQAAAPVPQAIILDPQGQPHNVAANLVDQYLASPQYKGWTKKQ